MTDGKPALGFVGLGRMGGHMTRRLIAAGYALAAYDIDPAKTAAAAAAGARGCKSPAEVARAADIVLTSVTDTPALEAAVAGAGGIVEGAAAGKLLVDLSSAHPDATRALAERLARAGMRYVDAPVSGGVIGAEKGTLTIFCGGDAADIARFEPIAAHIAQRITHFGPIGTGQIAKLCNQAVVGAALAVWAETVNLARRAGIDPAMLPEAFKGGFADSSPLQVWVPRMASRTFEPSAGAAGGILKDLDAAGHLARSCGAPLPMAHAAAEILRLYTMHAGKGADTASVVRLYDEPAKG